MGLTLVRQASAAQYRQDPWLWYSASAEGSALPTSVETPSWILQDHGAIRREDIFMQRVAIGAFALARELLLFGFATIIAAAPSWGQSGPGWVMLLDAKNMGD